jgi:hypothetical protein
MARFHHTVLGVFANHPKHVLSQKAEWFLYMNENRSDWKPNSESLELVIEAVAKSRQHNAAKQAFFLLQRFQSQITNPACLSYVLLACARASFSTLADRLCNFNLASRAGVIHSVHYDRLLTCAIRFAPTSEKRITMVKSKSIFDECLAAGLVDKFILRRFWALAPETMRRELFETNQPRPPKGVCDRPTVGSDNVEYHHVNHLINLLKKLRRDGAAEWHVLCTLPIAIFCFIFSQPLQNFSNV